VGKWVEKRAGIVCAARCDLVVERRSKKVGRRLSNSAGDGRLKFYEW